MPAEGVKFFSAARGARWNACGMEGERKICVARGDGRCAGQIYPAGLGI